MIINVGLDSKNAQQKGRHLVANFKHADSRVRVKRGHERKERTNDGVTRLYEIPSDPSMGVYQ